MAKKHKRTQYDHELPRLKDVTQLTHTLITSPHPPPHPPPPGGREATRPSRPQEAGGAGFGARSLPGARGLVQDGAPHRGTRAHGLARALADSLGVFRHTPQEATRRKRNPWKRNGDST